MTVMNKWQLESNPLVRRRLGKLSEEIGELQAVTGRIDIQGIDAVDPGTNKTNRARLIEEIADVTAQLKKTIHDLQLPMEAITERVALKYKQMEEWEALYKPQSQYRYTCTTCGGTNVHFDAWANWDHEIQELVLEDTFDYTYCSDCESECKTNWEIIDGQHQEENQTGNTDGHISADHRPAIPDDRQSTERSG